MAPIVRPIKKVIRWVGDTIEDAADWVIDEIVDPVVDTVGKLGQPAGALGPSTIVGSAAFNLLFISAVCIPAIPPEEEPKKIADMGVFITTAIFSLFAYLWLYICLMVWTPGYVTRTEGWLTLGFFILLLTLAFGMDKWN